MLVVECFDVKCLANLLASVDDLCLWLSEMQTYESGMVYDREGLYRIFNLADYKWASVDWVGKAMAIYTLCNLLLTKITNL